MSQQYWPLTDQFIITPLDVVNCLIGGITYQSCLERFEESAQDDLKKLNGGDYSCTAYTTDAYSDADDRADWTERRILDADIVIALLQATAPPLWYLAALAASGVAGAFPAMAPILCAQSYGDHWSCPASPNYPPGQTPQPDRGSR
jgi:hypothetical protein